MPFFIDCAKIKFCPQSINLKLIKPKLLWLSTSFFKPKAMTHLFQGTSDKVEFQYNEVTDLGRWLRGLT